MPTTDHPLPAIPLLSGHHIVLLCPASHLHFLSRESTLRWSDPPLITAHECLMTGRAALAFTLVKVGPVRCRVLEGLGERGGTSMLLRSFIHHKFLVCTILSVISLRNAAAQHEGEPYAVRISCGAPEDVTTKPTNTIWKKDFGYTGGKQANATIPSFIEPQLKTLRYFPLSDGPENCYFISDIPRGRYEVRLFFALIADPNFDNEPMFDISMEGTQIHSLKSGWSNNDEQSFVEALVFVPNASFTTCFHSTGHGDPSILSIEILQVDDTAYYFGPLWGKGTVLRTAKRLTCGTGKPAFDEDYGGSHWGGDRFWLAISYFPDSGQSMSTEHSISMTSISPNFYPEKLYQSAIVGSDLQPDLSFEMEVEPNRNYSVWLHFSEIDPRIAGEGERTFDISLNGDTAFESIDIIGMTGGSYAALVLNTTVEVSGKALAIVLRGTNGSHAIVNAIEVFEVIPAESKTSADEVSALQILKSSMGLPRRLGWNGDPCVPQQHPWSGLGCQFDSKSGNWVIDGLGLDNQGLKGFLPNDIAKLQHLQSINFSENNLYGAIPSSLGTIAGLQTLDLSYNQLNGSIPESLGQLTLLQILNLNGNLLSGRVPASLGGLPLHRASFNFTGNAGLCGIPGLPSCGPHLSVAAKIGIAFGASFVFLLAVVAALIWWKRRENILRAQRIAAAREAPYAKARMHFARDVQMTKHHRPHDQVRSHTLIMDPT
ncbi:Di-glucose binding within endoplasmic reticulum [Musa troglodytarum]|uniref:Di-glucose binding within endoplasmic reticulum n=1 Tax=Musa troglodytarum TaxID=320322 RepID=A0A9E7FNT7_9LILI|nr:Di-glucose binding within endoplasmic reticulum [Musa troglodytarum]